MNQIYSSYSSNKIRKTQNQSLNIIFKNLIGLYTNQLVCKQTGQLAWKDKNSQIKQCLLLSRVSIAINMETCLHSIKKSVGNRAFIKTQLPFQAENRCSKVSFLSEKIENCRCKTKSGANPDQVLITQIFQWEIFISQLLCI